MADVSVVSEVPIRDCYHYESGFVTQCKVGVLYMAIDKKACFGMDTSSCPKYQPYTKEQYEAGRAEVRRALEVIRQWPNRYKGEEDDG